MRRFRRQEGQSLVEFAVVLPLLLLLIVGIVEFGWLLSNLVVLRHASYDVVRQAAVGATDAQLRNRALGHVSNVVQGAGTYSAWYEGSTYVVRFSDDGDDRWVEMRLTPVSGSRRQGDEVRTQFSLNYRPFFMGFIFSSSRTFTIQATGRVEYPF